MRREVLFERVDGKNGVKIFREYGGIYLSTTRNGYQWTSFGLDETNARMIIDGLFTVGLSTFKSQVETE